MLHDAKLAMLSHVSVAEEENLIVRVEAAPTILLTMMGGAECLLSCIDPFPYNT